jgi:hypothetical protein
VSEDLIPSPCQGCRFAQPRDDYYVFCGWRPERAAMWWEWDATGLRLRRRWSSPHIQPPETCDVREALT